MTPEALGEVKTLVWHQMDAAITMLANAIRACPASLWGDADDPASFWYLAYHTLFFLDFYTSDPARPFLPPPPFTLSEMDPRGVLPDRRYAPEELLDYLEHGRRQAQRALRILQPDALGQPSPLRPGLGQLELFLYNMRHIQHHAGQLNLRLSQTQCPAPGWVSRSPAPVEGEW